MSGFRGDLSNTLSQTIRDGVCGDQTKISSRVLHPRKWDQVGQTDG
jgi:hypothetical protein